MKTILKITTLVVIAISFGLIATGCEETQSPIYDGSQTLAYFDGKSAVITHKIGDSKCPQAVTNTVVKCKKGTDSCTVDSAVITNSHPGLDANFDNGLPYTKLDVPPGKNITFEVKFNCNVAQSFEHTYKVDFYKDAKKVDEEEFEVKMKVE